MKKVLITQARNESIRLYNWVGHHATQGFDSLIYFDDFSTDDTKNILTNVCQQFNIELFIQDSDRIGNIHHTGNSDLYGSSTSLHNRIIRSLSHGLFLAHQLYNKCICALIDVDEYLVSNNNSQITNTIENIFIQNNINRIYCHSFDIQNNYTLNNCITNQAESCYRWDFNSRDQSIFKGRGKSICFSDAMLLPLPMVGNGMHDLGRAVSLNEDFRDYNMLRIHHFRSPPLEDPNHIINFVYDNTLYNQTQKLC